MSVPLAQAFYFLGYEGTKRILSDKVGNEPIHVLLSAGAVAGIMGVGTRSAVCARVCVPVCAHAYLSVCLCVCVCVSAIFLCVRALQWGFTYPLDVLKSRIQTLPDSAPPHATGIAVNAAAILRESGYRGFTVGLSTTLVRAVPTNAITFLVYEHSLRALKATADTLA